MGSIGTIVSVSDRPSDSAARLISSARSHHANDRSTTDAGRADIQAIADALTDVFIAKVARNMGVTPEQVARDFGQGGQLVGQQAIVAGMAHGLGSEDRLIQALLSGALPARVRPCYANVSYTTHARRNGGLTTGGHSMAGEKDKEGRVSGWSIHWCEGGGTGCPQPARTRRSPCTSGYRTASQEDQRLTSENAELRKQLARVQAERIQSDAQSFITQHAPVLSRRNAGAAALYIRAAETDATTTQRWAALVRSPAGGGNDRAPGAPVEHGPDQRKRPVTTLVNNANTRRQKTTLAQNAHGNERSATTITPTAGATSRCL